MFILLAALLFGASADARNPVLLGETTITSSAEIMKRIQEDSMANIKTKYLRMKSTFIPHDGTTGIEFDCKTGIVPSNGTHASITISNLVTALPQGVQTDTVISHYDCSSNLIFVERIRARGKTGTPLSKDDAVKFIRKFEVQSEEIYRDYYLENQGGETLVSIRSQLVVQNALTRTYTLLEIAGQKWLEVDQVDSQNERNIYITTHGGQFSFFGINFGSEPAQTLRIYWGPTKLEHSVNSVLMSQANFESQLQGHAINLSVLTFKNHFTILMGKMPITQDGSTGVVDSPFMRELQKNYERLLSNTDTEQVKLFFRKTIADITNGTLRVETP
jgi:hypothetical protein